MSGDKQSNKEEDSVNNTTVALDTIRMTVGYNHNGTKISRDDARKILRLLAEATGSEIEDYCESLALHYKYNKEEIESEAQRLRNIYILNKEN